MNSEKPLHCLLWCWKFKRIMNKSPCLPLGPWFLAQYRDTKRVMQHLTVLFPFFFCKLRSASPGLWGLCSIRLPISVILSKPCFAVCSKAFCRSWLRRRYPSTSLQKSKCYGNPDGLYRPSGRPLRVAAALESEKGSLGWCWGQCSSSRWMCEWWCWVFMRH